MTPLYQSNQLINPSLVSGGIISAFRKSGKRLKKTSLANKKCHRKQTLMCGYSDILLINDLGIA